MPHDLSPSSSQPEQFATGETGFAPDEPAPGAGSLVDVPVVERGLTGRLRRVTSSARFIPEVDGLRFIAIFSVLLFHLNGQLLVKSDAVSAVAAQNSLLARLFATGHIGVQLFFVVSGFILSMPFATHYLRAGKPISLRAYYLRRLTRLEPPYLLSLLLFFGLIVVSKGISATELFPRLAASAFYLHNLIYGEGSAVNFVAWSLEVEVQFYVLAPLIALLFKVRPAIFRRSILLVSIMVFVVAQHFLESLDPRIPISLLGQAQFFLVGFLLSDFYLTDWTTPTQNSKSWIWDAVAFVGWPCFFLGLLYSDLFKWVLPLAIFILYAAIFRGYRSRQILSTPALTVVGGMCYSIYLLHFQVIAAVWKLSSKLKLGNEFLPNFLLQFVLVTPFVLLVSAVFYLLIEKPCMHRDWPTRLSARLKRRPIDLPEG